MRLQGAGADNHQAPIGRPDLSSGTFQDRTNRPEVLEMRAKDLEVTAGDRSSDRIGPCLDAVGDQIVAGGLENVHALNQNPMRPGALDARSHRRQTEREVADFGIARRVENLGFTPREDRRHQCGFSRAHRRRRQHDPAAPQTIAYGPRLNVAGVDVDLGPDRLQYLEMQVDRPRANCAASWQGYASRTETG